MNCMVPQPGEVPGPGELPGSGELPKPGEDQLNQLQKEMSNFI